MERLRTLTAQAGGWSLAEPYVLHYLVAHAAQAVGDAGDLTSSAVGELLDDPSFVTRAEPLRLAGAVVHFRGRVSGCTARLVERCVHEFPSLTPGERLALLDPVAAQEVMPAPTGVAGQGLDDTVGLLAALGGPRRARRARRRSGRSRILA